MNREGYQSVYITPSPPSLGFMHLIKGSVSPKGGKGGAAPLFFPGIPSSFQVYTSKDSIPSMKCIYVQCTDQ